eukprot:CAMPEP_0172369608 /NCGR_PEP_ID=MMETSP1060-20121228/33493_1 /TAXON_ID=37318 /ORGANISM="Pseudo-nitzschia pungens, Strain cf. cingulata" /LENGTH=664 /DNA_ID=CAMNT_0013094577 /DNA_START=33 /DNA_END=2027 /DNA_ORIENTATION=+
MPPRSEGHTHLEELREPLLSQETVGTTTPEGEESAACPDAPQSLAIANGNGDGDGDSGPGSGSGSEEEEPFCIWEEFSSMMALGFPLAVSFFCRMGMASTDSAFVGHINDGDNTPEVYLAAAVLSDMVLSICVTPPLAFNQVLNGLVSQAIGSNNPRMAGIWLQQSMFWLAVTMLPCLAGLFYVEPILALLGFPAPICSVAGVYAKYNLVWPVPNGLYQCMRFYFQARGLPRPAMYNNIIFLFVNAFLNWTFVFGGPIPGWKGFGFVGAAISLSISRTLQGVFYYLYMFVYKKHHVDAWPEEGWSWDHHTRERTAEFMRQSLPNIGTLLFQACASQFQTILVGRLGELPIAASSALSTVTIPWSGTLSATCCTVSGVRVGYHLGRGNGAAARKSAWLVMHFITAVNIAMAVFFLTPFLKDSLLGIATDDENVVGLAKKLVPAMLVGTYLNLLVSNATSGIFSGQGRPLIATILSFGLELPLSIGGVAIYILCFHGNLIGVYWWGAISAAIEIAIVLFLVVTSDWEKCADDARERQEAASDSGSSSSSSRNGGDSSNNNDDDDGGDDDDLEDGMTLSTSADSATEQEPTIEEPDDATPAAMPSVPSVAGDEDAPLATEAVAVAKVGAATTATPTTATNETTNETTTSGVPRNRKKGGKKKRKGKR